MKEIDGSNGGGQLFRSTLGLAVVTEQAVRITGIRGDRPDPGLKPQHLTVLDTLADITDATVSGAQPGADTVEFDPGRPEGGEYTARIGTAGSISLLFDAVLSLASAIEEPLSVTAHGGTEVKWSPPLIVHQQVKLPFCREFGLHASIERHRTGFYPAGGGSATLYLQPTTLQPIAARTRGEFVAARCYSIASRDLTDSDVASRQAAAAVDALESHDLGVSAEQIHRVEADSTGSALAVELEYEHTRAGFDALGSPGLPAEEVASQAVEDALAFHASGAAVDRQLADQLLVFLAQAGGEMTVPTVTDHVDSSLGLLDRFGFELDVVESDPAVVSRV